MMVALFDWRELRHPRRATYRYQLAAYALIATILSALLGDTVSAQSV